MIGEWSEADEPLELDNSRLFFDIVAPESQDGPVADRMASVIVRLSDPLNLFLLLKEQQQNFFTSIPSAETTSEAPTIHQLMGAEALAEPEAQPQITDDDEFDDEMDAETARMALSATVEHLSGVYNLTDKQMLRAYAIAQQRETRVRITDDKRLLDSITLRKAPPTPYQDRRGK